MQLLTYLDFFGVKYSFYTDHKRKYYNPLGGAMTIFGFFGCLIILFAMSINDLCLKNPKQVYYFELSDGYKTTSLEKNKIWLPWRIMTGYEEKVNYTNILFPHFYYKTVKSYEEGLIETKKELKIIPCNKTNLSLQENMNFQKLNFDINQMNCVDMENLDLGGEYYKEDYHYLDFELSLCKNGENYDENNMNCTSFNQLKNEIQNNSWVIEFFFPEIEISPNNHENFAKIIYKSHFSFLSLFTYQITKVYLKEKILSDQDKIITNTRTNYSYYGLHKIDRETHFLSKDDIIFDSNLNSNSNLLRLSIYLSLGSCVYIRSYRDLFEIISSIWPICNIFFSTLKMITYLFKISSLNKKMWNIIFCDSKDEEVGIDGKVHFGSDILRKSWVDKNSISLSKREENNFLDNDRSKDNLTKFMNNRMNIQGQVQQPIIRSSTIIKNSDSKAKAKVKGKVKIKENNIKKKNNRKRLSLPEIYDRCPPIQNKAFSFWSFLFFTCGGNFLSSYCKKKVISNRFLITNNVMATIVDISSYIKLYKQFNILKNNILEKNKRNIVESSKRININDLGRLNQFKIIEQENEDDLNLPYLG